MHNDMLAHLEVLHLPLQHKGRLVTAFVAQGHAVDTYTQFVEDNADLLKTIPPPMIAIQYYKGEDLYYFDALQSAGDIQERRRPPCK